MLIFKIKYKTLNNVVLRCIVIILKFINMIFEKKKITFYAQDNVIFAFSVLIIPIQLFWKFER